MAVLYKGYTQPAKSFEFASLSATPTGITNSFYVISGDAFFGGSQVIDSGNLLSTTGNSTALTMSQSAITAFITGATASDFYSPDDPTDWVFAPIVPDEQPEALDFLADAVNKLLPAQAATLASQNAVVINAGTLRTGILSAGLSAAWYTDDAAGNTITNVVYDNNFNIRHTNTSAVFRAGTFGAPDTYGTINSIIDGVVDSTRQISAGTGTSGTIQLISTGITNGFWLQAQASINISSAPEGRQEYAIRRTTSINDETSSIVLFYDDQGGAPSVATAAAISATTTALPEKWLSGEQYLTLNDNLVFTAGTFNNLFNKVYSANPITYTLSNSLGSGTVAASSLTSVPATFNAVGSIVGVTETLTVANRAAYNPTITLTGVKPNVTSTSLGTINVRTQTGFGISTYGTVSTTTSEPFQDEAQRFVTSGLTAIGTTPFDSTASIDTDEITVRPGQLIYVGTGVKYYERRFVKAAASNVTINFGGLSNVNTQIDPFGTGDLNVILILEDQGRYFDLGRVIGDNNGTGDGLSAANSQGARNSTTSSGANAVGSFGVFSTSANNDRYRIVIIMRNSSALTLTSLTSS